jgi:outer membrane protein
MKKLLCMAILLSLAMAPSAAEAYWLDISAGYWNPTPSGSVSYTPAATVVANPSADLDTDLKLEKEGFAQIRAKVDLPLINFALMSTPMEFEGTNTLTRQIIFGQYTFPVTEKINTVLSMDHTDIALFWGIPFLETATAGTLNVELGLNARLLDFEATIKSVNNPTVLNETKSVSATIPMVYLGAQVMPTDSFSIEAEYRGISFEDNKYTDTMAMLKYKPVPLFYISAGYRAEKLELDEEGVLSDIEFKGPFAELGLKF